MPFQTKETRDLLYLTVNNGRNKKILKATFSPIATPSRLSFSFSHVDMAIGDILVASLKPCIAFWRENKEWNGSNESEAL